MHQLKTPWGIWVVSPDSIYCVETTTVYYVLQLLDMHESPSPPSLVKKTLVVGIPSPGALLTAATTTE